MSPKSSILPLLATLPLTSAWGPLGHATVAYIASSQLSPQTAKYTQHLLNNTTPSYLANIASWADTYRRSPGAAWSSALHYIDALDAIPENCNVVYARDCPEEGCIVSAIANYTSRAVDTDKSVGREEQSNALKFLVHFLADIHQPLHVENIAVGGNGINVTFEGEKTNLHAVWDTYIPEKHAGAFSLSTAHNWASELTKEIEHGVYKKEAKKWRKGMHVRKPIESAMVWARDGNAYVCETVLPRGADALFGMEIAGMYYESAVPVVRRQIAKAGVRLAAWLDGVVEEVGRKGHGGGGGGKGEHYKRGDFKLETWMEEARRARRAFGSDCGCGAEGHVH